MTTVQQVFDMTMHLMDEQAESSGATMTDDTEEYKYRTLSILNVLIPQLYPFSEDYEAIAAAAVRPSVPLLIAEDHRYPDFTQPVPLDDTLCVSVLPYGLAAHLMAVENDEMSAWFMARYNQAFGDLRSRLPGSFTPISTPYGLF